MFSFSLALLFLFTLHSLTQAQEYTEQNPCSANSSEIRTYTKCQQAAHIKADYYDYVSSYNTTEADFNGYWKNKETFAGTSISLPANFSELTFPLLRKAGSFIKRDKG